MKPKPKNQVRQLSILEASREFAYPRTTLRRILESAGLSVAQKATHTTAAIHKALVGGDGIDWRARVLRARALKGEQELAVAKERLVERAWVVSQNIMAAGQVRTLYNQHIHEGAVRLSALSGDVAATREELRKVWHEIFVILQGMAVHFEEQKQRNLQTK